ncbi:MAG: flavodoxin-dependent (E)-4-hydroxy-3-methylbut-2-enyl-diphosphate synthase [Desulfobacterales bacterium]|jgi:(E)-4-hydroxy-3-methylbut-2-enyl-diphosphate synthase|nr:flavodoxin-dependent (E)-4-hydroxy-3-methylbut-2-enyl-diphosphate synthase [Desulfobacterales bacterium]
MPFSIERKKTRKIRVGNVCVGGTAPVSVQSMTNTFTQDVPSTVAQIHRLEKAGCAIVRVAVPDHEAALAISSIKRQISIPIIADIHFDHRLAIASAKSGADGLRINPGNIGGKDKVKAVIDCAKAVDIPIRIGVNSGSLEKDLLKKYHGASPEAMVESAMRHIDLFASFNFVNVKLSIKASDVHRTVNAYRLLSSKTDLPLHVGVTEAGGLYSGIVKSSLGIGMLLAEGIGDTIRVSLTRDPVEEIRVGYEILKALDIRRYGPDIISCPTCGRCKIDLFRILEKVENALMLKPLPVKLAIMGCVVNGPGEAREADIGVAGGDGIGILFKKGNVIKKFPEDKIVEVLLAEIDKLERTKSFEK